MRELMALPPEAEEAMRWSLLLVVVALLGCCGGSGDTPASSGSHGAVDVIDLPPSGGAGRTTLEEAVANRRSIRDYNPQPLTREEISQLLWATQGITSDAGQRTAPSAGGLYPLEVYAVDGMGLPAVSGVIRLDGRSRALRWFPSCREDVVAAVLPSHEVDDALQSRQPEGSCR